MLAWNYNPLILSVLIIFLIVAIALVVMNAFAAHRQRTTLNYIQVFAASMHMLNQTWFLMQHVGRDLPCSIIATTGGFIYPAFQVSALYVIIQRSTCLLRKRKRLFVRCSMYTLVAAATITIAISNALRHWNAAMLAQGVCSSELDRAWNTAGKVCLIIVYLWILVVFLVPLFKHTRQMTGGIPPPNATPIASGTDKSQKATTKPRSQQQKLECVVRSLFVKIALAILMLLTTNILGSFKLFGTYGYVEFSLQNTAVIYASTLALESFAEGSESRSSQNSSAPITGRSANGGLMSSKGNAISSLKGTEEPPVKLQPITATAITVKPSYDLPTPASIHQV